MRTESRIIYTAAELKALDDGGAAFENALQKWREFVDRDDADRIGSEILDSIKAVFKAAGVELKDYTLSAYRSGEIVARFPNYYGGEDSIADLRGGRAMAWLENNLLARLRIPWRGERRDKTRKYGAGYRPGEIESGALTGICYDDSIIHTLVKDIRAGDTLREAFEGLAEYYRNTLEAELEYLGKPEQFLEMSEANGYEYDERGEMV